MKRVALFFLVLVFAPLAVAGQLFQQQELLQKGVDHLYALRLDEADKVFQSLRTSPAKSFHLGVLASMGIEMRRQWLEIAKLYGESSPPKMKVDKQELKTIERYMRETLQLCNAILLQTPDDFEARFFKASAYAFISKFDYYRGHYFDMIGNIKRSQKLYEALLAEDPTRGDAKLGPALSYYLVGLRSAIVRVFFRIGGLKGDRKKGLRLLEEVYDEGYLFKIEAANKLALFNWQYEHNREASMHWVAQLQKLQPNSILAPYNHLKIYHEEKEYSAELEALTDLLKKIEGSPKLIQDQWRPLILFAQGRVNEKLADEQQAKWLFQQARQMVGNEPWLEKEIKKSLAKFG